MGDKGIIPVGHAKQQQDAVLGIAVTQVVFVEELGGAVVNVAGSILLVIVHSDDIYAALILFRNGPGLFIESFILVGAQQTGGVGNVFELLFRAGSRGRLRCRCGSRGRPVSRPGHVAFDRTDVDKIVFYGVGIDLQSVVDGRTVQRFAAIPGSFVYPAVHGSFYGVRQIGISAAAIVDLIAAQSEAGIVRRQVKQIQQTAVAVTLTVIVGIVQAFGIILQVISLQVADDIHPEIQVLSGCELGQHHFAHVLQHIGLHTAGAVVDSAVFGTGQGR